MKDVVHVTKKDIAAGRKEDATRCPVALAVKRHTNSEKVYVFTCEAIQALGVKFILPRSADRFVRCFDSGKPVKPFNFILKKA